MGRRSPQAARNQAFRHYHKKKLLSAVRTVDELQHSILTDMTTPLLVKAKRDVLRHKRALETGERGLTQTSLVGHEHIVLANVQHEYFPEPPPISDEELERQIAEFTASMQPPALPSIAEQEAYTLKRMAELEAEEKARDPRTPAQKAADIAAEQEQAAMLIVKRALEKRS